MPARKAAKQAGKGRGLTDKQAAFVREYCLDWNATQAAKRAGYSPRTAEKIGGQLLGKTWVAEAIEERKAKIAERIDLQEADIAHRLSVLADANMLDFIEWGPGGVTIKNSDDLTRDQGYCVAEVTEVTTESGTTVRFKLESKQSALQHLGRYRKMFTDKTEHTGANGGPILLDLVDSILGDTSE